MKNEVHETLREPRAVGHFPSLSSLGDINPNTYMFIEDVYTAVMPLRGRFPQTDYSVELQGNPDDKSRATVILQSLTRRGAHGSSEMSDLLSDTVNNIATILAWHGRAVYEIIRGENSNKAWKLFSFTDKRLIRRFRKYIQKIPKVDQKLWGKTYVEIPKKDIWSISIPKVLGGRRGYRKLLNKLGRFSRLLPKVLMDEIEEQRLTTRFDTGLYRREIELYVAKTTAIWGWNMRFSSLRNSTELYGMYRLITLNWAKACLREHIINELNQLFQRLQIEVKIIVGELPTAQEILDTRKKMCDGTISFREAADASTVK